MSDSAETLSLRFTAHVLRDELQHQESLFERLDTLYSEFFFVQNDHIRFLHRLGDVTKEERDRQWAEVDAQEREWQARLDEWGETRFHLRKALYEIQARLRELDKPKEIARVAA